MTPLLARSKTTRLLPLLAAAALAGCPDDAKKPDTAPPELTIETPQNGATVSAPLTVKGRVVDPKVKGRKTSGVASVTVDGVEAVVTGEQFEGTVAALAPGASTIVVRAVDKAGNVVSQDLSVLAEPPVTGLLVEPPIVSVQAVDEPVQLRVTGFFEASGSRGLVEGLTFTSADSLIALVDASGEVRAASADAEGTTTITVTYGELSATVDVHVDIDDVPPGNGKIMGYFPESNLRDQTWTGVTEPFARVDVAGGAAPAGTDADATGRFWLNVPLTPNRLNDLRVTFTDQHGNASVAFPYPVRQSDGLVDAGTLYVSSDTHAVGFVGEELLEPVAARAYDPAGEPLPDADVTFEVVSGDGALTPVGGGEARRALTVRTDGAGYARARWRLGASDYDQVEVHAHLEGDVGFPVVFMAEGFARVAQETIVEGVVYDENRIPVANLPVTLLAQGTEYDPVTQGPGTTTDEVGHFEIALGDDGAGPAVERHLRLDGTQMADDPHVRIDSLVTVLPGQRNDIGTFWIPRLPEGVAPDLDANGIVQTEIVLEREVTPGAGPIRVRVPVGTKITWPGGVPASARKLTLLGIPAARTPMELPDGLFSLETLALQPGGTRFDPPLPLDLPNSLNEPPGAALTLWSYDHFQSEFVPVGRGVVSQDGRRIVSEPGSGIKVGAWHKASPPSPPPPCTATGQTSSPPSSSGPDEKPPKKKKNKCKCYIAGTDQPTACPEDKDDDGKKDKFVIPNVPGCAGPPPPPPPDEPNNPPPPKPPARKIEVVCEEKPLEITKPTEKQKVVKKGETVAFTAKCHDGGKSDGSIKWHRSAPGAEDGAGPAFSTKFDEEGTYIVSASANTKTCKGHDQRTIKVMNCAEVGNVRVCGDEIEEITGPTGDKSFKVSGNVKMGLKGGPAAPGETTADSGDLNLSVDQDMLVDTTKAVPAAPASIHMKVGFPIVGAKLVPIVYKSQFEVNGTGLVAINALVGEADAVPFRLAEFALGFKEFQMVSRGVSLKTPNLELFGKDHSYTMLTCPNPKVRALGDGNGPEYLEPKCDPYDYEESTVTEAQDIKITVTSVELTDEHVLPQGFFEWTPDAAGQSPGLKLGGPVQLKRIKLGYEAEKLSGELGLEFSLARYGLELGATFSLAKKLLSASVTAKFHGVSAGIIELPGIPIIPAVLSNPVYLTSVGVGFENVTWPPSPTNMKFFGTAGVTFGPTLTVLTKKIALATGSLKLTIEPYPMSFTLDGAVTMFDLDPDKKGFETKASPVSLTGQFKLTLDPRFALTITGGLAVTIPEIAGVAIGDPFIKGEVKGAIIKLPDDSLKATLSGSVLFQIPKTRFTPTINVLSGAAAIVYGTAFDQLELTGNVKFLCAPYQCTLYAAHDGKNGFSAWIIDDRGDFVVLAGINPNKRVKVNGAPSLGVTRATPVSVDYDGDPASFELLEAAPTLAIVLDKEPGDVPGVLHLPSGDVVAPEPNPAAFAEGAGVDFDAAADGLTATWIVYDAQPGTYTYVGQNDAAFIHGLDAFIPQLAPSLAFAEPLERTETGLFVTWTPTGAPSSGAETVLVAVPEGDARESFDLATVALDAGAADIDDGDLPYGTYRILARTVADGVTSLAETGATYVLGAPPAMEDGAPRLIRVGEPQVDAASGMVTRRVSWLPSAAATGHLVTLYDGTGSSVANVEVAAPRNHADVTYAVGSVMDIFGGGRVLVTGETGEERVSAELELPRVAARVLATPPPVAPAGALWRYVPAAASPRTSPVVVVDGPPAMFVAPDGSVQWAPGEDDHGDYTVTLRLGVAPYVSEETFTVRVAPEGAAVAPSPVASLDGRTIAGVVDEPLSFAPRFQVGDPDGGEAIALSLVMGPLGATFADGVVSWTPTAAEATEAGGRAQFVVRAELDGLTADATWVVTFEDRDGDGLSDAWERASGTNPSVADAPGGDPDADGLTQAAEARLGTRGDLADSDGDGIDDGDEATLTTPPDGFTLTSDPRLTDADADGLSDALEAANGTAWDDADSDDDGVPDGVEVRAGTDPAAKADADGDGLSDDREAGLGTDPARADTDGDGLNDREEVEGLVVGGVRCSGPTNPLLADTDSDGVDDSTEARRCDGVTDPNDPGVDDDDDGLLSDRERVLGTSDLAADTDGDGVDDPVELAIGTDPTVAGDVPEGIENVPNVAIAQTGASAELVMAAGSLVDFGTIYVFVDADRDLAPDDFEAQYGYSPDDPADAYSDDDGDLVPMWREAQLGTDPRAADSDGDGVSDGQELQDGTDPTDGSDFSTAGPVTALVTYPRAISLDQNTFLGSAQLQLTAVGTRADGTTTDLSAPDRGTTWVVEPAAAGTVDASAVFTGTTGFEGDVTVRATNLALSAESVIHLGAFTPSKVASIPLAAAPTAVAIAKDDLLVGGPWGVRSYDVTDRSQPLQLGEVLLPAAPTDLAVSGGGGGAWVAAACGAAGVAVVERGAAPRLVAVIPTPSAVAAVAWAGGKVVAATGKGVVRLEPAEGVGLVDLDDDGVDDRLVDTQAAASAFTSVSSDLDRVVAARSDGHVVAWRLVVGGLVQELDLTPGATAKRVALRGGLVSGSTGGTASQLALVSGATWRASASLGLVEYTRPAGEFVLATESQSGTVNFLDARGAAPLTTLGNIDFDAFFPNGLAVDRRFLYLADGYNKQVHIAAHSTINDVLGVPPVVVPLSPLIGATIPEGTSIRFRVAATDDVAVRRVVLTRDGEDVVSTSDAPYEMVARTSNVTETTTMTIGARAEDYGGNVGTMTPLTFEVTPIVDLVAPTVTLREPSDEEFVASGSEVTVAVEPADDHAVYAVEVRVGGELVETLYSEPWITSVTVPAGTTSGRVTVEVTAIDYGDNTARASAELVLAGRDLVAEGVTRIAPDDTSYEGQDILVRKGTVAIDGPHTFGKVRIGRDGTLTHSVSTPTDDGVGLDLACERLDVAPTGAVDVTGKGYLGDCATGSVGCYSGLVTEGNVRVGNTRYAGGSHGGRGGGASPAPYGAWDTPAELGGSGGYGINSADPGGNGGGRVRVVADTAIVVHGAIRANGARNGRVDGGARAGAGAGGSIWLTAPSFGGDGVVEAAGGFPTGTGGVGAGGRVAIATGDLGDFDVEAIRAWPGGSSRGALAAPGTVWLAVDGAPTKLVVDDGRRGTGVDAAALGAVASDTPVVVEDLVVGGTAQLMLTAPLEARAVTVANEAVLTQLPSTPDYEGAVRITAERLTVAQGARIDVSRRGYLGDCAAGATSCYSGSRGPGNSQATGVGKFQGGSHGGAGGGAGTNATYDDDIAAPALSGTGGGYGVNSGQPGGNGGGRVLLAVGDVTIDGAILAEGGAGVGTSGGGAGGSVLITATTVTGDGRVSVDGGAAPASGAGGGGRVAITSGSLSGAIATHLTARPGTANAGAEGGAGTVYTAIGATPTQLVVDDGGRSHGRDDRALGWSASATPLEIGALVVRGETRLVMTRPVEAGTVRLEESAVLTQLESDVALEAGLTVTADRVEIGADAAIDVSARGYLGDCSPGASNCYSGSRGPGNSQTTGVPRSAGGSHGGVGGGAGANPTYDALLAPAMSGTGGGYGVNSSQPGGDGGGRVRLVTDALVLDGAIRADGGATPVGQTAGGGAGGAVWITATSITGAGEITADGGGGGASNGGGGRVAVDYVTSSFDLGAIQARPGGSAEAAPGSPGTVITRQALGTATLVIDDGGAGATDGRALGFATGTDVQDLDVDLVVRGTSHLVMATPLTVKTLRLEGTSVLTHVATATGYEGALTLVADEVVVAEGAAIDVSGRGYRGDCAAGSSGCYGGAWTIGNSQTGAGRYAGGSYGGVGAGGSAVRGYGDPFLPKDLGAGGGYGVNNNQPGGSGGGRVWIVADALTLDGAIRADGAAATGTSGGGSGGSVLLQVGELGGGGAISALGGAVTADTGSNGGGGGRVAVLWATDAAGDAFDVDAIAVHGGLAADAANRSGGPGTLWLAGPGADRLVVDNGGGAHVSETAPWKEVGAHTVTAVNGAAVTVSFAAYRAGALVGQTVVIGDATFEVVDNGASTLTLDPAADGAGVVVGDTLVGARVVPGDLELRGAARVAVADRVAAANLMVADGAVLTHPQTPHADAEAGIALDIDGTATITEGAAIDVSARGYLGDCSAGAANCYGGARGVGNTAAHGAGRYAGGSHAGLGGGNVGWAFGDPFAPVTLGGGGGYGANNATPGGNGGGRLRLVAGTVVVDGAILADGGVTSVGGNGGGGAGGSVFITADAFGGMGTIVARGGDGHATGGSGSGGGGRVALVWTEDVAGDVFDVDAIEVRGGIPEAGVAGGPGTLWLAPSFAPHRLVVDNGGVAQVNEVAPWPEVGLYRATAATASEVTVAGAPWVPGALVGRELVFGDGATRFTVVANTASALTVSGGDASGVVGLVTHGFMTIDGGVELHGGARVALDDRVEAGSFAIDGGAVLTHLAAAGGAPDRGVWLDVDAMSIASDGAIDVSERGYRGDCQGPSCYGGGWTNGNSQSGGALRYAGGSFGGKGGGSSPAVYGGPTDVFRLGSGGGYGSSSNTPGGNGGGRVKIVAGSLSLDGPIHADGQAAFEPSGGGAGGGVDIAATTMTGSAAITARGGQAVSKGGGGGGRIYIQAPGSAGAPDVSGGASGTPGSEGAAGTIQRN